MPDVYKLINRHKDSVKYNRYILAPSYLGMWTHVYSINTKNGTNISCEIHDGTKQPEISQSYNFKFCSLIIKLKSKIIYKEQNTKNVKEIYTYMDKLYKAKQR